MLDQNSVIVGFISGQIVLLIALFYFIKVFLFATPARHRKPLRGDVCAPRTKEQRQIFYNDNQHDWLNMLLAKLVQIYRTDSGFNNRVLNMIQASFKNLPSFIDRIDMCHFSLGDKYPAIKSCRYCNDRAEIALEFYDNICIRLETQILINWPRPGTLRVLWNRSGKPTGDS